MTPAALVLVAREYAERLRRESRQMGYTQADIDEAKFKPMDLGAPVHVAWLKRRIAVEIDNLANAMEALFE